MSWLKKNKKTIRGFGLDMKTFRRNLKALPQFYKDKKLFLSQMKESNIDFSIAEDFYCLQDVRAQAGVANGHYFHQDWLVASYIYLATPKLHVDVGSRVDGFVAHVGVFRKIEVIDIRKITSSNPNIDFKQADMMKPLPREWHNYTDSLSCLHALEHFGLGRYGDPIDFTGYIMGLNNLWSMLKPNGILYLSVPIGPQRIEFHAHRIFGLGYLLQLFSDKFIVEKFAYVDDKGDLHQDVLLDESLIANDANVVLGCGIFSLRKITTDE